jgi:DNA topoisomerase IB
VAETLGNTPAVCRSSYIDPRVFDRFDSGATIESAIRDGIPLEIDELRERDRARIEKAVVELVS